MCFRRSVHEEAISTQRWTNGIGLISPSDLRTPPVRARLWDPDAAVAPGVPTPGNTGGVEGPASAFFSFIEVKHGGNSLGRYPRDRSLATRSTVIPVDYVGSLCTSSLLQLPYPRVDSRVDECESCFERALQNL
jgi:hypothetical protein